jgi:hypothetical protein
LRGEFIYLELLTSKIISSYENNVLSTNGKNMHRTEEWHDPFMFNISSSLAGSTVTTSEYTHISYWKIPERKYIED